ncbi:hypothetical protein G6L26_012620 [Agrobacterium radiobacter]|jgi:hypothetical protein|nr:MULTISPECIES: hypothetical protein [Agrobacterium]TGE78069.1 hypothetical protein C9410_19025 [Rhizobium sp. SEMIA 439]KAA1235492.1 hypothetical protein FHL81_01380 [Agrobacterium tumefaciens]KAB0457716.1 hypothetical protein F7R04_21725 [Agrobacterium tumefaciens]MCW8058149.1 hypothetical protein [Agrobacterium tumefaciens]MCW8145712.1 hypothetical protein [Agrobacterium tumefaciens]
MVAGDQSRKDEMQAFAPETRHRLDFSRAFLFIAANQLAVSRLQAADRDPQRYKEIPEVNTRQRDAPSGAFWLCVLFLAAKAPTFRKPRNEEGRNDV